MQFIELLITTVANAFAQSLAATVRTLPRKSSKRASNQSSSTTSSSLLLLLLLREEEDIVFYCYHILFVFVC